MQLRLTPEQAQEKEGIETQLGELNEAISLEEDDEKKATLQEELTAGQGKLDALMDSVRVGNLSCKTDGIWRTCLVHCKLMNPLCVLTRLLCVRWACPAHMPMVAAAQKLTLDAAARGEIQRPSERRAALEAQQQVPHAVAESYGHMHHTH